MKIQNETQPMTHAEFEQKLRSIGKKDITTTVDLSLLHKWYLNKVSPSMGQQILLSDQYINQGFSPDVKN